jgi:Xaa-Pro aminopeptidase
VLVVDKPVPGGDKEMLGFETLTFVPIEKKLIDVRRCCRTRSSAGSTIIMPRCWRKIGPQLEGEDKAWLERQCAPLSR